MNKRISPDIVKEWRKLKRDGWKNWQIAEKYSVAVDTISKKLAEEICA
jgi:hypothetical protein